MINNDKLINILKKVVKSLGLTKRMNELIKP